MCNLLQVKRKRLRTKHGSKGKFLFQFVSRTHWQEETYSVNRMSYKWPNTGKWEMTRENKEKSPCKGMN